MAGDCSSPLPDPYGAVTPAQAFRRLDLGLTIQRDGRYDSFKFIT